MAQRTDIKKILIIGSGPIIIGQACEFDYSGTQCLASLGAGVVEFTSLSDDDWTGADDENLFDVGALRHIKPLFPKSI